MLIVVAQLAALVAGQIVWPARLPRIASAPHAPLDECALHNCGCDPDRSKRKNCCCHPDSIASSAASDNMLMLAWRAAQCNGIEQSPAAHKSKLLCVVGILTGAGPSLAVGQPAAATETPPPPRVSEPPDPPPRPLPLS
jgi:hypothetical protein